MKDKIIQILVNAAEFGDTLNPNELWEALGEDPKDHLSEDGMASLDYY